MERTQEYKTNFMPAEILPITDLGTMKLLVAPRRLQILSLLIEADRTVKEVAEVLQTPASRLYYHFNMLERNGLIAVTETHKVAGTIEKRYRAVALNYLVDPALLSPDSPLRGQALEAMLFNVLDTTRRDIIEGVQSGKIELGSAQTGTHSLLLRRTTLCLTPSQAEQVYGQIETLLNSDEANDTNGSGAERTTYTLVAAFFPFEQKTNSQPGESAPEGGAL